MEICAAHSIRGNKKRLPTEGRRLLLSGWGLAGKGNELEVELHPHAGGEPLEGAQRRVSGSVLQSADVGLVDAGRLRKLRLCKVVFLAAFDDGADDLELRLQGVPFGLELDFR